MGSGGVLFSGTNILWLRERTFLLSSEGADRNCCRRIPRCSQVNLNSVSVSFLNCGWLKSEARVDSREIADWWGVGGGIVNVKGN